MCLLCVCFPHYLFVAVFALWFWTRCFGFYLCFPGELILLVLFLTLCDQVQAGQTGWTELTGQLPATSTVIIPVCTRTRRATLGPFDVRG